MATGSTEAFASASQSLPCFNTDLLQNAPDKFWTAEVMATASTGGFWEDDPEVAVKKKVNELKHKFHSGRQLQIKHLPRDVTEEEIRELLSDFPVQTVQLQCGTGSGMARATLEDPEMLEEWDRDRVFLLRGQRVPVQPTPTEMMLCIARLPLTLTENQFSMLVRKYGDVRRCFLMISEKTGDSKGYGFVEYTTKEAAMQAKNMLDGKHIEDWILCCDWLDSSHITLESLHSKCLYVDRLPKDFRNMDEFRKVISSVVTPPYCQIALKNGCPQDWGLVEFSCSEDAEHAQMALNGFVLRGQSIRMCYYIPGVRAINLYLKLLNDSGNKGKAAGLLPDPPAPAVFQQLQNLAKQNPAFAQSLQNIIWTQIQNMQAPEKGKKPSVPTPNLPDAKTPPPVGAENAQAALVILLAAQMQAQMGSNHPSLLGNPQMADWLQNLIKQSPAPPPPPPPPRHPSYPLPPSQGTYPFAHNPNGQIPHNIAHKQPQFMKGQAPKVPLLPNPSTATVSPPPAEVARTQFSSPDLEDIQNSSASYWNGILGQLQGQQPLNLPPVDSSFFDHGIGGPKSPLDKTVMSHFAQPPPGSNKIPPASAIPFFQDSPADLKQTIHTLLSKAQNLGDLIGTLTSAIQTQGSNVPRPVLPNPVPAGFPFVPQPGSAEAAWLGATRAPAVTPPQPRGPPVPDARHVIHGGRPMLSSPVPAHKPVGFVEMKPNQFGWSPAHYLATPAPQFGGYPGPGLVPNLWSHPASPILVPSPPTGLVTPVGQKRKYSRLLPSPEPSPEGNYIGQHSQGLGGHYADSYFKRKKKN